MIFFISFDYCCFSLFDGIWRFVAHGKFLTLYTGDTSVAHCFRLTDMCLHKAPILLQKNTNTHQKHRNANNYDTKNKYFQHYFATFAFKIIAKIGVKKFAAIE